MSEIVVTATVRNTLLYTSVTATTTIQRNDNFTLGVTKPIADNTGLNVEDVAIGDLYIYNGDLVINDSWIALNGNSKDRWYVKGHVTFAANTDFTFTNSYFPGRVFTGAAPSSAVVRADSTQTTGHLDLINCRVTCIQPHVDISTIAGKRIRKVHRSHIDLGSDSVDCWDPSEADIIGCYFGPMSFWANDPKHTNDPQHPGWSHNDHIQISGVKPGARIRVRGNNFDIRMATGVGDVNNAAFQAFSPSRAWGCGVMMTPGTGHIYCDVSDNWYSYGEIHISLSYQPGLSNNTDNSVKVNGNRHDMNTHPYGGDAYQIIRGGLQMGMTPADITNNTWSDDVSVPVALRGQPVPAPIIQGSGATGQYIVYGTK